MFLAKSFQPTLPVHQLILLLGRMTSLSKKRRPVLPARSPNGSSKNTIEGLTRSKSQRVRPHHLVIPKKRETRSVSLLGLSFEIDERGAGARRSCSCSRSCQKRGAMPTTMSKTASKARPDMSRSLFVSKSLAQWGTIDADRIATGCLHLCA